ncbi:magnesium-translocating P-type ATPase [Erwinia sp. Ejp617]|nr:magnesium-translocating P-type ATPase [Erwinia sp. Ejp617]
MDVLCSDKTGTLTQDRIILAQHLNLHGCSDERVFQSGWFVEGLLSQTLVVHMLRTQKIPFIQSRAALPVMLMTGLVMAMGLLIPFSPLGQWF